MKPLYHLIVIVFLNLSGVSAFGQDSKNGKFDFFAKGQNSYTLGEKASYGRLKYIPNGQDYSRSNNTNIDLDWNRWFGKGFGAGLSISADWSGTHYINSNADQLSRDWVISPNLSYGKTFSDRLGVYGRAEVSFGKIKEIYKGQPVTTTDKSDLFGYGGSIGVPYRFSKYTALTAELSYDHLRTKNGDASKEDENSFGVNLHLEDYLPCRQMRCDYRQGFSISKNKFDKGSAFITYDSELGYLTGNRNLTYNNPPLSYKNKFSNLNLDLNGSFYLIDYVAIGGGLNFGHSVQKSDDNTFKNTWDYFNFDPQLIVNAPVDNGWRNVFLKAGGYFGSEKSEVRSVGLSNTDKHGITGYNFGVGYYAFFAEETAVQSCIYYRSITYNDKNSDSKATYKGVAVSVGLVHSFGR